MNFKRLQAAGNSAQPHAPIPRQSGVLLAHCARLARLPAHAGHRQPHEAVKASLQPTHAKCSINTGQPGFYRTTVNIKNNAAYALTVISPRLQRPPSQSHLPRTIPGQAHITIKNNKTQHSGSLLNRLLSLN